MSYILFLDDERDPDQTYPWFADDPREVVVARGMRDFHNALKDRGCPSFIGFDFYLGFGGNADNAVYDLMHMYGKSDGVPIDFTYNVHSSSSDGVELITQLMDDFFKIREKYLLSKEDTTG